MSVCVREERPSECESVTPSAAAVLFQANGLEDDEDAAAR
jgi:hypothetical protein